MRYRLSPQSIAVLRALAEAPEREHHGYAIGRDVGIKAGSLYPILIRLADRGMISARWEDDPPSGRPRRHLYRILAAGQDALHDARAQNSFRAAPQRQASPGVTA